MNIFGLAGLALSGFKTTYQLRNQAVIAAINPNHYVEASNDARRSAKRIQEFELDEIQNKLTLGCSAMWHLAQAKTGLSDKAMVEQVDKLANSLNQMAPEQTGLNVEAKPSELNNMDIFGVANTAAIRKWFRNEETQTLTDMSRDLKQGQDRMRQDLRVKQLEKLSLACHGMWNLLSNQLGLTDEDLEREMHRVDMLDGHKDGQYTPKAESCTSCGSKVPTHSIICIFCGTKHKPTKVF